MDNKLLFIDVVCPKCGADLNEGNWIPLDGMVVEGGERGVIKLSAYFGEYSVETDLHIPQGALVQFFCPRCEESLMVSQRCEICRAPLASLELKKGGHVDFCSCRGCTGHALGSCGNVDEMIELMNKITGTPNY